MATRCNIAIYDSKEDAVDNKFTAMLYRHSDGYPEGVLPDILPFLKWWNGERGLADGEYTAARLLQYLCNLYDGHSDPPPEGLTGVYGYGICNQRHGDIEYFYKIYPCAVEVYSVPSGLIETIEID